MPFHAAQKPRRLAAIMKETKERKASISRFRRGIRTVNTCKRIHSCMHTDKALCSSITWSKCSIVQLPSQQPQAPHKWRAGEEPFAGRKYFGRRGGLPRRYHLPLASKESAECLVATSYLHQQPAQRGPRPNLEPIAARSKKNWKRPFLEQTILCDTKVLLSRCFCKVNVYLIEIQEDAERVKSKLLLPYWDDREKAKQTCNASLNSWRVIVPFPSASNTATNSVRSLKSI